MNPRRYTPGIDRPLKTAFRDLVLNRVGSVDAALATYGVRVGRSQLGSYLNPHEDAFARIDVVAALEDAAGEPIVTAELARRAGCILLPIDPGGDGELALGMAKLSKETGEAIAAFIESSKDGKHTLEEIDHLISEVSDVHTTSARTLRALRAMRAKAVS